MSLTESTGVYKPFKYQWAYDFWERQQQMHWLPREVPLAQDVSDYRKLDDRMRQLIDHIFRFFTQADVEIQDCYHDRYARIFKPTEVKMMLTAFSNMETIHIDAYSKLLDTLGIPESEYAAFQKYEEMKAKSDWFRSFDPTDEFQVAETLAAVSGFGEGLYLFASFAILLNFPRHNLMKGMGQIVSWSVRDESLHCEGIMRLFHQWLMEHPSIDRAKLQKRIESIAAEAVRHEDAFIDLVFQGGDVPGMTKEDTKRYIRYIANLRLRQLGYSDMFHGVTSNPLPWVDTMQAGVEHANFFETRATEYSKAATKGDWDDVF